MVSTLTSSSELRIRQRRELAELVGFETRNKYEIQNAQGQTVGFAAEQNRGFLGFLFRQFLGHWRRFEIHFFGADRQKFLTAVHPFRFIFQRLEILDQNGTQIGALQQRFAILTKSFDVEDGQGQVLFRVRSPIWRIWTFPFVSLVTGAEVGRVEKKWSGLLREAFTDQDFFRITFTDPALRVEDRLLLLAAGVFIDLQYFEIKAR